MRYRSVSMTDRPVEPAWSQPALGDARALHRMDQHRDLAEPRHTYGRQRRATDRHGRHLRAARHPARCHCDRGCPCLYTDGLTSYAAASGWAWVVPLLAQRGSLSCSSGSSPNSSAAGGLRRPRTGALLPVVDSRGAAMRFEGLPQVARAALARRVLLAVDAAFGRSVSNGR